MRIRNRGADTLQLYRVVFDREARRSRDLYLGSLSKYALDCPAELKARLTEAELAQLESAVLAANRKRRDAALRDPYVLLVGLAGAVRRVAAEVRSRGAKDAAAMRPPLREAQTAWRELLQAARKARVLVARPGKPRRKPAPKRRSALGHRKAAQPARKAAVKPVRRKEGRARPRKR